ncbi:MAG: ATP-binding protein [Clostridia bacterium]|nr:ATP-binding protein [Clostridia bacterium]
MTGFLGREKELCELREILSKQSACVMIYGVRRVGKTTLLLRATKESPDTTIYYECSPDTMLSNVNDFMDKLFTLGVIRRKIVADGFDDVFEYLDGLDGTLNIIIDEYPFLKNSTDDKVVDGMFQRIADQYLSHIRLFVLGSSVAAMSEIMERDNPLFGRFDKIMEIREWDYREASLCYPDLTPYDKVAFFSVFGGTPYVNVALNRKKSLRKNISDLFLADNGRARVYAEQLLVTTSAQKFALEKILRAIGNGMVKYTDIKSKTGIDDAILSRSLRLGISMGLIRKDFPVNRPDENKKVRYEISDNAVRFFYTFVSPNLSALNEIGTDGVYKEYIEPKLAGFVAYRFEEICREYFGLMAKGDKLEGVRRIGRYYYDDPKRNESGEFDVVLMRKNTYDVYDAKYLTAPMTQKAIDEETADIKKIDELGVENIGFISVSGFEEGCEGILITGEDLYG